MFLVRSMDSRKRKSGTLETETTSFLLFAAGAFFLLEGLIHYEDFFVTNKAENSVSIVLVVGSVAVALLYLLLAYSCLKNPGYQGLFLFTMIISGLLSASYFVLAIVEFAGPKFYFESFFNYIQFLSGYGSVTIFIELLIAFFSFRVYRLNSEH
jgi:hypothetical protein